MNGTNHWAPQFECETCNKRFRSQTAAEQHMDAQGHRAPRFACETCNQTFRSEDAAKEHMTVQGHWAHYCAECGLNLKSANNLRMHLNSRIHRGVNVTCPFCSVKFATASGVAHHLETGSCPKAPKLNRETIARLIAERDLNSVITKKQLTWHGAANATYEATDAAFNGRSWECYICHRQFRDRQALNQHLSSPAHQQKVYHCVNRRCGKEFVSLAALFNHLESESCGAMRFEEVQRHADTVLSGNVGLIAFG